MRPARVEVPEESHHEDGEDVAGAEAVAEKAVYHSSCGKKKRHIPSVKAIMLRFTGTVLHVLDIAQHLLHTRETRNDRNADRNLVIATLDGFPQH